MAAPMPPDDVSALMTRVELDRSQYKVFDRRLQTQVESCAPSRLAFEPVASAHSRVPSSPIESPAARSRWTVLNSLLSDGHTDHVARFPEALLVPMLTFSAGPGGVGKTTILSSVARILSGMGESLFLVYADSQRTLPLHFGGQQVVPGRVRTFVPPAREFGELHFYAHSQDESGIPEEVHGWLPRQTNALAAEVGRVLCEITNSEIPERQTRGLASINLRVLVPDINSVLAVNRDLAELENEQDCNRTFYLLNKYDSTVRFHKDVRERLSTVLGERLLPFVIRRTDQITEALAAGVTIVDYAPHAPVVEDFKLLAQWLRNSMQCHEIAPPRTIF